MPSLPLAPKEIPLRVADADGAEWVFYHRPPPKMYVAKLLAGRVDESDFEPDFSPENSEEGAEAKPKKAVPRRRYDLDDADAQELFAKTFLRATGPDGTPLTIEGVAPDFTREDHFAAIPDTWVVQIVSELTVFVLHIPKPLEKNSNSPVEASPEGTTSSPVSAGEAVPSSSAT